MSAGAGGQGHVAQRDLRRAEHREAREAEVAGDVESPAPDMSVESMASAPSNGIGFGNKVILTPTGKSTLTALVS